jgi:hypothetical protein
MTPLERRYRRILRLLPTGYRQAWEEDMVDAYMESASHDGGDAPSARSRAEHLSVVGLAVRLRLSGVHASPRGLASRGAVHGFALVGLLYLALGGILNVSGLVVVGFPMDLFQNRAVYLLYWLGPVVPALLWVAACVAVVIVRAAAARVLVLGAFLAQVGLMIANLLMPPNPYDLFSVPTSYISAVWREAVELSVADGVWLAVVTAATFLAATLIAAEVGALRLGPGRWFWLGGAVLLALVQGVADVDEIAGYPFRRGDSMNPGNAVQFGLLVAMLAALAALRNPGWVLALSLFVVVFAGNALLDYLRSLDGRPAGLPYIEPLSYWQRVDFLLVALAAACAAVGLIGVRRLPRVRPSAPEV